MDCGRTTPADAAALYDWVNNKGGAIIAMSGYFSDSTVEIVPLNQLLAPFGITYEWGQYHYTSNDCPNPPSLCYCAYGSISIQQLEQSGSDITRNLGKVGVFMGRSITCPGADCQIVGTNNVDTTASPKSPVWRRSLEKAGSSPGATSG